MTAFDDPGLSATPIYFQLWLSEDTRRNLYLGSFWYAAVPGINTSNFCGNGPSGCTPISSTTGYSVEYPALYGILIYSRYFCSINDNVLSRACYCLHKCPRRISSHLTFAACQPDKTSTSRRLYRWAYTIGVWHVYTPQFYVCCHCWQDKFDLNNEYIGFGNKFKMLKVLTKMGPRFGSSQIHNCVWAHQLSQA